MKAILSEPAFVGREIELQQLEQLLESAIEGKGKTVFVSGEAGSGKTRIAREFLNTAKRRGAAVMAGWCLSDAQVPFFPFIEAFNSYSYACAEKENLLQPQLAQVALGAGTPQIDVGVEERGIPPWLTGSKATEKPGKPPLLSPQAWKDHLFAVAAKTLQTIANQAPLVLFIEDLHWADSASLALLHYISRVVNDRERVLVLATFRSEELTADAEGHPHPLDETLRLMGREELFIEVKLSSLNRALVSEMAENMIGGHLEQKFAERLASESRGSPLFVVESLRMLYERKSLIQENNEWRLAVDELGIPKKIKDIILRRISCLKYAQRRVLDAASVIGEEFGVELLSTVLGQDSLEILETLNVLAHSTSLVCVEENHYRFDHARSRETLYEELSPPLKRGYHNRIGEKLEGIQSFALPLSDLAYHFTQAGNREKSLKYALGAAKDELARWSNAQAIKHFQYVLQNITDDSSEEKRTALEGLGDAFAASSMYEEAIKTFDQLAANETGVVRLRALRKAMDAAFLKADKPDLLLEYAKKAEELGIYDHLEMARILNSRGRAFGWAGRGDPRLDLADSDAALKVFEEENSVADAADALWRSGIVNSMFEDLREKGLNELLRSVAIFREIGDVRKEIEANLNLGVAFNNNLFFAEAAREFSNVLRIGEKLDVFNELSQASAFLSWVLENTGKLGEAVSNALKAWEYCKKANVTWLPGFVLSFLVRQYSKLGETKQADECFEKMSKLSPEILSQWFNTFLVPFSKGVYFAAKTLNESNQFLEKIIEPIDSRRIFVNPVREFSARTSYCWILERQGRFDEAKVQQNRAQKLSEKVEEKFGRMNVQLSVMVSKKVQVGEEFEMRLDLVNVSLKPGLLLKVEGLVPCDNLAVIALPSWCSLQKGYLDLKEKAIGSFKVETVKLRLKARRPGSYDLMPEITYKDELGNTKTFKINPITIAVQPVKLAYQVLPGRMTTGYTELDRLLLGGIPEKNAVVLIAPSSDERALLIKRFLEAGAEAGETTLHVTAEAANTKTLAEEYPSNFYLIVCNPQADTVVQSAPNIFKLKGVENLTEIDITLTKAFRALDPSTTASRRICIEIMSDALLQHHAVTTRRWLSALLPSLKSRGFTVLATINPKMHPSEEYEAIIGLFDGEISIYEKEAPEGAAMFLRIKRMTGQKYLKDEIPLTEE